MTHRGSGLLVLAVFCAIVQPNPVAAASLIPGTFEDGQDGPRGWLRRGQGAWADAGAHGGKRCLRGRSLTGEVAWESQVVTVQRATDYRLEGWLKTPTGETRLAVEVIDDKGQSSSRAETPTVKQVGDWRYVAVEFSSETAVAARVLFWVKGEADLDDVTLAPVATSYIGNKSVEADDRGRVPFWGEEKTDSLLAGRRGGRGRADLAASRTGKTSLELTATGDWYAWSSPPYPHPAWTDRLRVSAWMRCEGAAKGQLLACWLDDMQKVLRVDAGEPQNASEWREINLIAGDPPPGAATVRVAAVARGGRVWFDDFELLRTRARQRVVRVFVNQIGYERDGPKSAIVATNFFPSDQTTIPVRLLTPDGRTAAEWQMPCAGRVYGGEPDDWGWYFWRADFTSFKNAGTYRAATSPADKPSSIVRGVSPEFRIGRGLLLAETAQPAVDFFFIQRCGFDVPGWHKACHLDDAKLPDGTHVNVTGGWHSAGDYNKLSYEHGDGGVVFALLAAHRANPRAFEHHSRGPGGLPDVLDEARWGADFMAKMQVPETGGLRNHVHQGPGRNWTKWSAPEVHTDNKIGTPDDPVIQNGEGNSPLLIGGWARLSVLLTERGVRTDYLERAERLWDHATKRGTQVASPHLLLSALEIHRATGKPAYLNAARQAVEALLAQQSATGSSHGAFGSFGAIPAAALAQFALDHPGDGLTAKVRDALRRYIQFCANTADNPFGFSRQPTQDANFFFPPSLGNNFEVLGRVWAAALIYRVTGDARALAYAADQMDWVLGKNPEALCMFEGKGERNPPRYHHRYNAIPGHERGAVPGCIPNGFVRDMGLADRPGFDLSRGGNRSPSFRTSEPWLVHNLYYLLAAGALDQTGTQSPERR